MANLKNNVSEFRRQFNITKSFKDDQVFKIDPRGNLIAVWNNEDYYLTNKRIQQGFFLFQRCNINLSMA